MTLLTKADCTELFQGGLFSGVDGEKAIADPPGRSNFRFLLPLDKVVADTELNEF